MSITSKHIFCTYCILSFLLFIIKNSNDIYKSFFFHIYYFYLTCIHPSLGMGIFSPLSIGIGSFFSWTGSVKIFFKLFPKIGWNMSNLVDSEWCEIFSKISLSGSVWASLLKCFNCKFFNPDLEFKVFLFFKVITCLCLSDQGNPKQKLLKRASAVKRKHKSFKIMRYQGLRVWKWKVMNEEKE